MGYVHYIHYILTAIGFSCFAICAYRKTASIFFWWFFLTTSNFYVPLGNTWLAGKLLCIWAVFLLVSMRRTLRFYAIPLALIIFSLLSLMLNYPEYSGVRVEGGILQQGAFRSPTQFTYTLLAVLLGLVLGNCVTPKYKLMQVPEMILRATTVHAAFGLALWILHSFGLNIYPYMYSDGGLRFARMTMYGVNIPRAYGFCIEAKGLGITVSIGLMILLVAKAINFPSGVSRSRLFSPLNIALHSLTILFTFSTSAYAGIVLVCLVLIPIYLFALGKKQLFRMVFTLSTVVCFVSVLLIALPRDYVQGVRARTVEQELENRKEFDLIKNFVHMGSWNNFLFGVGPGNIELWRIKHSYLMADRYTPDYLKSTGSYIVNMFFDVGIIGTGLLMLFIFETLTWAHKLGQKATADACYMVVAIGLSLLVVTLSGRTIRSEIITYCVAVRSFVGPTISYPLQILSRRRGRLGVRKAELMRFGKSYWASTSIDRRKM